MSGANVASKQSAQESVSRAKGTKIPMGDIHGLAVHAAGAQLLPYKYNPGDLA